LYHNLNRHYQKLITVKEYKESISTRIFSCSQVSVAKVDSLQEAYEIAERAETTKQELQERNESFQPKRRNLKNVTMVTQARNFLTSHPIYRSFRNEDEGDYSYPYYEKQLLENYEKKPNIVWFLFTVLILKNTIDRATEVINKETMSLMGTLLLLGNSLLL